MEELLKKLFGDNALTFSQFSEALSAHPEIKLANLASGEYVANIHFCLDFYIPLCYNKNTNTY